MSLQLPHIGRQRIKASSILVGGGTPSLLTPKDLERFLGLVNRYLDLLVEILSSVYLRNYRTAVHAGLDEAALNARVERQFNLIFDGARPR